MTRVNPDERFRQICLALPEAEEVFVENWGHPTFRVRGKMFASMGTDKSPSVAFKTDKDEREALMASGKFTVPAYVGRYGWLQLQLGAKTEWEEVEELITTSWLLTAPKSLGKQLSL
jgi:predicted DNA-binding protein (MmcQ/YjbR family)